MELDEKITKRKKEVIEKATVKKVVATRISGIKGDYLMFRSKDGKIRNVPVNKWTGGDEQNFIADEFAKFSKPAFYKGD